MLPSTRSFREILEISPEEEEEVNVGRCRRSPLCSGTLDDKAAADDNAAPGPDASSTPRYPQVPDREKEKQAVDISALPLDIIRKVRLIGGIEPLKELKETLLRLRSYSGPALRTIGPETAILCTGVSIEVYRSIEVARAR